MEVYFCLVSDKIFKTGMTGRNYVYAHRSEWKTGTEILPYLSTGWVRGVDYVVSGGKAYMLNKSYIDVDENFVVHVAVESVQGCDL